MKQDREANPNLTREVADKLRMQIMRGELAPGSRLVESRIATELGISRTPIREAARLLESEGLLGFDPNRGFSIRQLTLRELTEVFDVRICIERHAVAVAAQRRAPQLIDELRRRLTAILEAVHSTDDNQRIDADFGFHHAIVAATDNQRLLRIYDDAAIELRLILSLLGNIEVERMRIAESHGPVIAAIASGDPAAAAKEIENHIRLFWDDVLRRIGATSTIPLGPIAPPLSKRISGLKRGAKR